MSYAINHHLSTIFPFFWWQKHLKQWFFTALATIAIASPRDKWRTRCTGRKKRCPSRSTPRPTLVQIHSAHLEFRWNIFWLVAWTPLKNISQLGWLFPIYGKIVQMFQTTNQLVLICVLWVNCEEHHLPVWSAILPAFHFDFLWRVSCGGCEQLIEDHHVAVSRCQ